MPVEDVQGRMYETHMEQPEFIEVNGEKKVVGVIFFFIREDHAALIPGEIVWWEYQSITGVGELIKEATRKLKVYTKNTEALVFCKHLGGIIGYYPPTVIQGW